MSVVGEKLSKTFPGTRALDQVDIRVDSGTVHALLGANGSGKSTLVKILTGVYQPDCGAITVGDRRLRSIASPTDAIGLGIAVVHQEAPLIDSLTVGECMALFRGYPTMAGRVRWRTLYQRTADTLARYAINVDPRRLAASLRPAERALVALALALDHVRDGLDLLVLDEATASLPEDQASQFLERVGDLAKEGAAVLMVTHRLAELHGLADDVTVLRDGHVVYAAPAGIADDETLVRHMISTGNVSLGHRHRQSDVNDSRAPEMPSVVLDVVRLEGETLQDVSFRVHHGEILGVAGLLDSGVDELPQILAGALPRRAGAIRIGGYELPLKPTPRQAIAAGLAYLPADRLRSGGVGSLSVGENVVLPDVRRYWHRSRHERATVDEVIERLDVRPSSRDVLFRALSGGNQQKVLLGKWLLLGPSVLVLDDPTSGVDPGAREKIFDRLRQAADQGVGIVLFSTEPEQLASMCSRALVLRNGVVSAELSDDALTRESLTRWCYA